MPVPDNVIRANIRATVASNEELVHTLHFHRVNTTTTDNPSLQEIATKIVEEWTEFITVAQGANTVMNQYLRADLIYRTVDVYELDSAGHAESQAQAAFGATAKGLSASTAQPPEVACVASLRTGLPGRSKRGRLYLGGFTSNTVGAGGVVSAGLQASISSALAKFGTDMKMQTPSTVDRLNWVVLSRTLTQVNRVTEVRVGSLFDVQRRRQNGIDETYTAASIAY